MGDVRLMIHAESVTRSAVGGQAELVHPQESEIGVRGSLRSRSCPVKVGY